MLAIKSINGVEPAVQPLEDGYSVTCSDLLADGSGRSAETGTAIRYLVRKNVFKIALKFKDTPEKIRQVDELVSTFTQTACFLYLGEYKTLTFYPSDRSIADRGELVELSVNLVEV